jgi:energy-coupling factor transporter ATP-binding protein EcfA2
MPARALSGGQRQAVAISAMVLRPHAPSVILFDEPLTHLDEANALACVELIEMLASRGHTMVIVQHDIDPTAAEAISPARRRLGAHLTETRSLAQLQGWPGAARP